MKFGTLSMWTLILSTIAFLACQGSQRSPSDKSSDNESSTSTMTANELGSIVDLADQDIVQLLSNSFSLQGNCKAGVEIKVILNGIDTSSTLTNSCETNQTWEASFQNLFNLGSNEVVFELTLDDVLSKTINLTVNLATIKFSALIGDAGESLYFKSLQLSTGNWVVMGRFTGNLDLDLSEGTSILTSDEFHDGFIAVYDPEYNLLHSAQLVSSNEVTPVQGVEAADGTLHFTGRYKGIVDFDPGIGVVNNPSTTADFDIFLLTLEPDLSYKGHRLFTSTGNDEPGGLSADSQGNLFILGWVTSSDLDIDFDGVAEINSDGFDAFVVKLGPDTSYLDHLHIGGVGTELAYNLAMSKTNSFYITGMYSGTVNFNPKGTAVNRISSANADIFVAKYSSSLQLEWVNAYPSNGANNEGRRVELDDNENVYVGFRLGSSVDLNPSEDGGEMTLLGAKDNGVLSLDKDGIYRWSHQIGGSTVTAMQVGAVCMVDNHFYLMGGFNGSMTVSSGNYSEVISAPTGLNSFYAVEYSPSGAVENVYHGGGNGLGANQMQTCIGTSNNSIKFFGNFTGTTKIYKNNTVMIDDFITVDGSTDSLLIELNK